MDIELLSQQSPEQIAKAFERFDLQHRHSAVGYLADAGITRFHLDRMLKAAEKLSPNLPIYAITDDNGIAAIVGISPSKWHEEIYGVPYYKIAPFYVMTESYNEIHEIVNGFKNQLCNASHAVYTLRMDAQQHLAYELSKQDFVFVGTSIRYHLGESKFKSIQQISDTANHSLTIRDYDANDLTAVQQIARNGHRHSHFFHEPRFGFEQTQNLFAEWIQQCAKGDAKIWVAENGGKIIGFASCLETHTLQPYIQKRIGIIDFIVVDPEAQGMGAGKNLLQHTLQWFKDRVDDVELRTMADNLQAIRFYEAYGFRVLSSDHHFHLWKK